ncbi:N,N'-diacetylchitobiose transport system substrate-binding protein [Kutzneria viridogrisea]|uniref:N,N'-diacetylchitobiose transport system substrate-binding protein n=2 Tax=Kutzneria TaxID=43356 RepID=A0ABR6BMM0_9PSEU|nr:extracellular solute-binding protein [Kutzneria albida]AHH96634.1 putative secreted protein [Kutzneria albida DSM 43870]MBA8928145.1 N,N'-diacetylchitobiose transport system substrate-binding protein [Kutzneria viridogrisea]
MRRRSVRALAALSLLGLSACSVSAAEPSAPAGALTVWLMADSAPPGVVAEVNKQFQTLHPGVRVTVQTIAWSGRATRWEAGMASATPPDVVEMGNSDVVAYAVGGKLTDLSGRDFENSETWLAGLREAGTSSGKLYGVPYYGGARVVIYRKDLWQRAGLGQPPGTVAELRADALRLMAANPAPDFSGLSLPGRYQYAGLSFVFDAGGSIATQRDGKWVGALSTAKSVTGLQNWLSLATAVSRVPADADETTNVDQLGTGRAAMVIGQGSTAAQVAQKYPQLGEQLGVFPLPGVSGPAPVFLGGSNLVVPKTTQRTALAAEWIKLITGTQYEGLLGQSGLVPNSSALSTMVGGITAVELAAAQHSWFTPASPRWSAVDNANIVQNMFQSIRSGWVTPAAAAATADEKITQLLNSTG